MSFRKSKGNAQANARAWRDWIARQEQPLKRAGLPPGVMLTESHWRDFLDNGYLEVHPEANDGFSFDQLRPDQMRSLLAILESSPARYSSESMIGFLRVRLGL